MLGLVGIGKARSLTITLRIDISVRAPGQRLVGVGLVRNVKDNLVDRGVKHAMKRNRKLNDAQVGGNVSADSGGAFEDGVANLAAEQRKLGAVESLDVLGRVVCVSSIVVGYSMRIERRRSLGRHNCTRQSRTFWRLICDGGAVIRQLVGQNVLSDAILMCSMMFLSIVHRPWLAAVSRWKEAACPMPFVPRKSRAK